MDRDTVDEIKRHFGVVTEGLDDRIRLVAEGQDALRGVVEGLRHDVKNEFGEVKSMVKFSYAELDRRVTSVESELRSFARGLRGFQNE